MTENHDVLRPVAYGVGSYEAWNPHPLEYGGPTRGCALTMHVSLIGVILGTATVALLFVIGSQELAAWTLGLGGGLALTLWTRYIRTSSPTGRGASRHVPWRQPPDA